VLERRLRFGGFGEIESIDDKTNVVVQLDRLRAGVPFCESLFAVERGNDPTQTASAGNDAIDFRDLGAPVETGAVRPDFSPVQKNGRNSGIGIGHPVLRINVIDFSDLLGKDVDVIGLFRRKNFLGRIAVPVCLQTLDTYFRTQGLLGLNDLIERELPPVVQKEVKKGRETILFNRFQTMLIRKPEKRIAIFPISYKS